MVLGFVAALAVTRADGDINVFAAASLKEAFTTIAAQFEAAHRGSKVLLTFAGSQQLAAQINNGAPADVFASAAEKNLDAVQFDKTSLRIFAQNRLAIAVRRGFSGVSRDRDLTKALRIVVADPSVPVGGYFVEYLRRIAPLYGRSWVDRVQSRIVSRELDVKAVLAKVQLGEADAGVVYESDIVTARGHVLRVAVRDSANPVAEYPVATLSNAPNKGGAKDFTKFLFEDASQQALARDGFISPARATKTLWVGGKAIALPLPSKLLATVTADGPRGKESFRGVPVASVIGRTKASQATFIGGDRYTQTISVRDVIDNKAILVKHPDGNYQLVVPGLLPKTWVHWLRRIDLR